MTESNSNMEKQAKHTICLWYDRKAEDAARFYAQNGSDPAIAKRTFDAMMQMKKIDVAAIEAAVHG